MFYRLDLPIPIWGSKTSQNHGAVAVRRGRCRRQKGLGGWELAGGRGAQSGSGGARPRGSWSGGWCCLVRPDPSWPSLRFILGACLPGGELGHQTDEMRAWCVCRRGPGGSQRQQSGPSPCPPLLGPVWLASKFQGSRWSHRPLPNPPVLYLLLSRAWHLGPESSGSDTPLCGSCWLVIQRSLWVQESQTDVSARPRGLSEPDPLLPGLLGASSSVCRRIPALLMFAASCVLPAPCSLETLFFSSVAKPSLSKTQMTLFFASFRFLQLTVWKEKGYGFIKAQDNFSFGLHYRLCTYVACVLLMQVKFQLPECGDSPSVGLV
uniref:uncharacterized protein LOC132684777 n=1 Tax=Panthera onca TaxID=9690 RepID=UPI0029543738|nr:uncharacterized protein LOC132684777 [Panthera onca]